MTARNDQYFYQAANSKVYIGTTLCGSLPGTLENGKVYSIPCNVVGDYVKLVNGDGSGNGKYVGMS